MSEKAHTVLIQIRLQTKRKGGYFYFIVSKKAARYSVSSVFHLFGNRHDCHVFHIYLSGSGKSKLYASFGQRFAFRRVFDSLPLWYKTERFCLYFVVHRKWRQLRRSRRQHLRKGVRRQFFHFLGNKSPECRQFYQYFYGHFQQRCTNRPHHLRDAPRRICGARLSVGFDGVHISRRKRRRIWKNLHDFLILRRK